MDIRNIEIKNKVVNHLMLDGKKKTGEIILLKSLKEIQKASKKQSKELAQLAIIYSTPTFKLHRSKNKKKKRRKIKVREIPAFITSKEARVSLAIKFILKTLSKKESSSFYIKLKQEFLLNAQNKGFAIQIKNELQKQVITKKRFFYYYRWR